MTVTDAAVAGASAKHSIDRVRGSIAIGATVRLDIERCLVQSPPQSTHQAVIDYAVALGRRLLIRDIISVTTDQLRGALSVARELRTIAADLSGVQPRLSLLELEDALVADLAATPPTSVRDASPPR